MTHPQTTHPTGGEPTLAPSAIDASARHDVPVTTGTGVDHVQRDYDAVLLASFGGPNGQDDVIPFLRNVTRGRGIPDERLEAVSTHYRTLGGVSPINEQNLALQAALQAEVDARGLGLPVLWGNRNWHPYVTDVVAQVEAGHAALPREVVHRPAGEEPLDPPEVVRGGQGLLPPHGRGGGVGGGSRRGHGAPSVVCGGTPPL
mgnify:CR=1 FL=1